MNKIWQFFLLVSFLFTAICPISSCSDNDKDDFEKPEEPENPEVPDTELKPGDGGLGEGTPTPISNAKYMVAEGGNDGVTIEVSDVTHDNFTFVCKPGQYVKSYRMDVYPLATLFNYLFEARRTRPEVTVDDLIIEAMFNAEGNGAFSFSISSLGENWDSNELIWKDSKFAQAEVVPGSTYVIATVGCHDDKANEIADLSLCFFTTKSQELIGEPKVGIDARGGYTVAAINYTPNPDCYWYYQFCTDSRQINEFIEAYGEKMYIDFMRQSYSAPTDAKNEDIQHNFSIKFDNPDPTFGLTATAIGLDVNKTPGTYSSQEFFFQKVPDDAIAAEYSLSVQRMGATILEIKAVANLTCRVAFYRTMTTTEWNGYKDNPAALKILQRQIADEGYALDNRKATQDGNVIMSYDYGLLPDTEYVILSVARNEFMQITDIVATEPFKTKKLVFDPEGSASKVEVTLSEPGRTNMLASYKYNAATAMFYHQYIIDPTMLADYEAGRPERLIEYLKDYVKMSNYWEPEKRGQDGVDEWKWTGLDPAGEYTMAMMGEDWEGKLSAISLATLSTIPVEGGPNPISEIKSSMTEDGKTWFVNFAIKQDVKIMNCLIDEDKYSIDPDFTYEECMKYWLDYVLGEAAFKSVNSITMTKPVKDGVRYVALAVPFGEKDGQEVRGDLQVQIYDSRLGGIVAQEDIKNKIWGSKNITSTNWVNALMPVIIHKDNRVKAIAFHNDTTPMSFTPLAPMITLKEEKELLNNKHVIFIDLKAKAQSPHGFMVK